MPDSFSNLFDNVILEVLNTLKRIEHGGGSDVVKQELQRSLKSSLDGIADDLQPEVRSMKYAVVAWIDEMMQSCGWSPENQEWWINHCLEMECFGTSIAYSEFYRRAKLAKKDSQRSVIEAYATMVAMGFRGCYRKQPLDRTSIESDLNDPSDNDRLPDTLEEWAVKYYALVPRLKGEELPPPAKPTDIGAPALKGRLQLILPVLVAFVIVTVLLAMLWNLLLGA